MSIALPITYPIGFVTSGATPRRIPRPDPTRPDPSIHGSQVQIVQAVEGRRLNGLGL